MVKCEYIWLDGCKPTAGLRAKTKIITNSDYTNYKRDGKWPIWGADGSSTEQAKSEASDIILAPVLIRDDPTRANAVLLLCEVYNPEIIDGKMNFVPHPSNTRRMARELFEKSDYNKSAMIGLEQEYFLMNKKETAPVGWIQSTPSFWEPESKFREQGPYYCGIGAGKQAGREIVERHLNACIKSELAICGINAEVALGQWEFQIGGTSVNALEACDHMWMARYLLYRVAEEAGVAVNINAKPVKGNFNGSGMHCNVSFRDMREAGGLEVIEKACQKLGADQETIQRHLDAYGDGYQERLTGLHETCRYDEFKYGYSDRTCSVRIPWNVAKEGFGALEDRRPNANADPYRILTVMLETLGRN